MNQHGSQSQPKDENQKKGSREPKILPNTPPSRARSTFKIIPYSSHTRYLDGSGPPADRPKGGAELRKYIMNKHALQDSRPPSANNSDGIAAGLGTGQFPVDSVKPHLKGNAPRKSPIKLSRGNSGLQYIAADTPRSAGAGGVCNICHRSKANGRGNNKNQCNRCAALFPHFRRMGMKLEDVSRIMSKIPNFNDLDDRALTSKVKEAFRKELAERVSSVLGNPPPGSQAPRKEGVQNAGRGQGGDVQAGAGSATATIPAPSAATHGVHAQSSLPEGSKKTRRERLKHAKTFTMSREVQFYRNPLKRLNGVPATVGELSFERQPDEGWQRQVASAVASAVNLTTNSTPRPTANAPVRSAPATSAAAGMQPHNQANRKAARNPSAASYHPPRGPASPAASPQAARQATSLASRSPSSTPTPQRAPRQASNLVAGIPSPQQPQHVSPMQVSAGMNVVQPRPQYTPQQRIPWPASPTSAPVQQYSPGLPVMLPGLRPPNLPPHLDHNHMYHLQQQAMGSVAMGSPMHHLQQSPTPPQRPQITQQHAQQHTENAQPRTNRLISSASPDAAVKTQGRPPGRNQSIPAAPGTSTGPQKGGAGEAGAGGGNASPRRAPPTRPSSTPAASPRRNDTGASEQSPSLAHYGGQSMSLVSTPDTVMQDPHAGISPAQQNTETGDSEAMAIDTAVRVLQQVTATAPGPHPSEQQLREIATEWMRHHVEEETLLQEQAAGGQPASPQRLIDSLISLSAQDATCSRLGTELRTLLANIIPPQRSVLQHQLQRQQVQDVEMAVVDAAPNSGPVGGTGTDAVSAPMSTLANPHSTSKPGENPLAIEAAASPRLSEPQGRLLASPGGDAQGASCSGAAASDIDAGATNHTRVIDASAKAVGMTTPSPTQSISRTTAVSLQQGLSSAEAAAAAAAGAAAPQTNAVPPSPAAKASDVAAAPHILGALTKTTEGDATVCTFCAVKLPVGQGYSLKAGGDCSTLGAKCTQVTCYNCIPTEAEVDDLHSAAAPLGKFMARVIANRDSADHIPNKLQPATTDAIYLWDAFMLDINTSWQHRCHHFHTFQQRACKNQRSGQQVPSTAHAVPAAAATPVASAATAPDRSPGGLGSGGEGAQQSELQVVGQKRRSSPSGLSGSQPPAARMRLQELHRSAEVAIQEAENSDRLLELSGRSPYTPYSRPKLRVDPERLSHTFFSRKPLQDASQMLEEALDKLKSLLPASDDHTQRAATIQSMKASKGKPAETSKRHATAQALQHAVNVADEVLKLVPGGPHTTLEALVQDIADRAEQLHDAPDVTVAMELAVQVLNASLTLHFAVPSLPSVRCALDKAVSGLKEVDAAVATGVTSDMLASLEKQMQAATTSVRVALLHMPTGMDHAVAAMECCQATITGKDFVGTGKRPARKTIGIPSDARPPQHPLGGSKRISAAAQDQPSSARGPARTQSQTTPPPTARGRSQRRRTTAEAAAADSDAGSTGVATGADSGDAAAPHQTEGVVHRLPSMTDFGNREVCVVCERTRPICVLPYCYGACESCATLWVHCMKFGLDLDEVRRVWRSRPRQVNDTFPTIARLLKELGVLHSEKAARKVWEAAGNVSALSKFTHKTPVVRANQPKHRATAGSAAAAGAEDSGTATAGGKGQALGGGSQLKHSSSAAAAANESGAPPKGAGATAAHPQCKSQRGSSTGAAPGSAVQAAALPKASSTTGAAADASEAHTPQPVVASQQSQGAKSSMSGLGGATAAMKSLPMPSMTDFGPKTECVICGKVRSTCLLPHAMGACETCATLWVQCQRHGLVVEEVKRVWQLGKWAGQYTSFVNAARALKAAGALASEELAKAALQSVGGSVVQLVHYQEGDAEEVLAEQAAEAKRAAKAAKQQQPPSPTPEKNSSEGSPEAAPEPVAATHKLKIKRPKPGPHHPPGKTFSLPSMQDFGPKRDCVVCKIHRATCTLPDALGACQRCAVLCIQCARYGCTIREVRRLYKLQLKSPVTLAQFPNIARNMKEQGLLQSNSVAKRALNLCGSVGALAKFQMPDSEYEDSDEEEEPAPSKKEKAGPSQRAKPVIKAASQQAGSEVSGLKKCKRGSQAHVEESGVSGAEDSDAAPAVSSPHHNGHSPLGASPAGVDMRASTPDHVGLKQEAIDAAMTSPQQWVALGWAPLDAKYKAKRYGKPDASNPEHRNPHNTAPASSTGAARDHTQSTKARQRRRSMSPASGKAASRSRAVPEREGSARPSQRKKEGSVDPNAPAKRDLPLNYDHAIEGSEYLDLEDMVPVSALWSFDRDLENYAAAARRGSQVIGTLQDNHVALMQDLQHLSNAFTAPPEPESSETSDQEHVLATAGIAAYSGVLQILQTYWYSLKKVAASKKRHVGGIETTSTALKASMETVEHRKVELEESNAELRVKCKSDPESRSEHREAALLERGELELKHIQEYLPIMLKEREDALQHETMALQDLEPKKAEHAEEMTKVIGEMRGCFDVARVALNASTLRAEYSKLPIGLMDEISERLGQLGDKNMTGIIGGDHKTFLMQSEAEAWVFRTTEVLEAGGADAAQLRHSRQARKRMPTDARDSRHISDAGGLMVKNPRKSKEGGTPAPSTGGGGGGAAGPSKGGSEAANTANTDGKRSLLDAWRGEPSWRNPQGKKVNAAPKTESPERPQHAPLPANAVPGVEASVDFSEPPLPDPKAKFELQLDQFAQSWEEAYRLTARVLLESHVVVPMEHGISSQFDYSKTRRLRQIIVRAGDTQYTLELGDGKLRRNQSANFVVAILAMVAGDKRNTLLQRAHTTLAEERIILKDEFLAKFTQGARLKVHDLPDVPKTIQSHITNLLVRYARVFRLFDIRGEPGFPISLVRSCRRGSHSQWVGVACIVHLMVESDNSMTYPYAWHVVERCVQDSESMRDSLNKFRDKTEQGLPLSGSRQTFCKDLADLLADTLPERFGPNHLSYDRGVDVSKEFLDGEISEEYEGVEEDQEGSDNGEE